MADFVSTTNGKIVNVDAIAFLTSRQPAAEKAASKKQLIVGFSSSATGSEGGLIPLSLVLEAEEATDFLDPAVRRTDFLLPEVDDVVVHSVSRAYP